MAFLGDTSPLYDSAAQDSTPETWPLHAIMQRFVDEGAKSLRVALPAAITAIEGDQTVDVQPLLKVRYTGAEPTNMPQIKSIPVVMPQGGDWRISYPLAVGDMGIILVVDRSLDTWLAGTGSAADPQDTRCHHLADAVFLPGIVPTAMQTQDTSSDLVLGNGSSVLRLQKNGHLQVNNATLELISVLSASTKAFIDTLQALSQAQVLTALGPAPFLASSITQFAQLQARVNQILTNLDTFKA